jgi:rRNA maturation protein Nop10
MREDLGGDPVCWLNRVCENCGRFIGDEFAEVCEHCGAARYDDEPAGQQPDDSAERARR